MAYALSRIVDRLAAFRRNQEGVAAIEFAFIVPVMLLLCFGILESARAYTMYNRFMMATSAVGDLLTKEQTMTATQITQVFEIIPFIMDTYPSDAATFDIKVVPVIPDKTSASNPPRIYAQVASRNKVAGQSRCAVAANLTDADKKIVGDKLVGGKVTGGVVKVIGTYVYKPLLSYTGIPFTQATWTTEAIYNPRSDCVTFPTDQKCTAC